jgi:hypothetical protein
MDKPDEDFDISDDIIVKAGKYTMYGYNFEFSTYSGRRVSGDLDFSSSEYYGGKLLSLDCGLSFNLSKHLNVSG